jgi:magnesium-transporting ATPase (P-type)
VEDIVGEERIINREQTKQGKMLEAPWALSAEELQEFFKVDREKGLSKKRVSDYRHKYGKNVIRQKKKKSVLIIFIEQLRV